MQVITTENKGLVKAWVDGVQLEDAAKQQLINVAGMPFIHKWVAAMPDVHWGMGATVGSVIPTRGAIIPAAVGVDIGCGMMAVQTTLRASDLPTNLSEIRSEIERHVPHGRTNNGQPGDRGAWANPPDIVTAAWAGLHEDYADLTTKYKTIDRGHTNSLCHLGTLGTGNHFIEICLDTNDDVWVMLHSGSRGVGNKIGQFFIEKAKQDMKRWFINLPDVDLAYLAEGSEFFGEYIRAVSWAQSYARANRDVMMSQILTALKGIPELPPFTASAMVVNCHHNYISKERHYGEDVWVTRKGAVSAKAGELGIIPGSMGTRSYIVEGKGNPESFTSCSHGAGRAMSRTEAKRRFTIADHEAATQGVECRKDADVIDETPAAYKDIDAVMAAQADLVDIRYMLKQVLCIKG